MRTAKELSSRVMSEKAEVEVSVDAARGWLARFQGPYSFDSACALDSLSQRSELPGALGIIAIGDAPRTISDAARDFAGLLGKLPTFGAFVYGEFGQSVVEFHDRAVGETAT